MNIKRLKEYFGFLIVIVGMFALVGCGNSTNKPSKEEASKEQKIEVSKDKLPIATIVVKGYGTMEAELYPNVAPNTVNNFIELANKGFYDNLTFHRIIKGFMIQGGDPEGTGKGGPGYTIKGEFTSNGFENNLKHEKGILSMARTNKPDSAGSQFFIVTGNAGHLDKEYAAFGKVISGLDVLEKIESVKTGANDKPVDPVIIESVKVDTKGLEYKSAEKMK